MERIRSSPVQRAAPLLFNSKICLPDDRIPSSGIFIRYQAYSGALLRNNL